jgi:WD40 repeat protein
MASAKRNGHAVQLWDVENGKLQRDIPTGLISNCSLAVSANGKTVAVSGTLSSVDDKGRPLPAVAIVDIASGKQLRLINRELNGPSRSAMAMTPDSKHLVSLDQDGALRIEETATGKEVRRHQLPRSRADSLALSGDGSVLVMTGVGPAGQLLVWNWQTEPQPRELTAALDPPNYRFNSKFVTISANGNTVADVGEALAEKEKKVRFTTTVRIWDMAAGKVVSNLTMSNVAIAKSLALSPDGKTVIASARTSGDSRGLIHIWDVATGKLKHELKLEAGALVVSPDSRLLAGAVEGAILIWELQTAKQLSGHDEAHTGEVNGVAAAGNRILTCGIWGDQTARLWNAETGKQVLRFNHPKSVRAVALSPDASKVLVAGSGDSAYLWDAVTGKQLFKFDGDDKGGLIRAAAGFSPDGNYFFSCSDHLIMRKWETATGKLVLEYKLKPVGVNVPDDPLNVRSIQDRVELGLGYGNFSPDCSKYVLPVARHLHLFDVETGKDVQQIKSLQFGNISWALAMSPDGRLILEGTRGRDKPPAQEYALYEQSTGQTRLKLEFPSDQTSSTGPVAFAPDGKLFAVATGEPEAKIRIYSTANGKEVGVIQSFRGHAQSLCFAQDSSRLISGMRDTTAIVWDLKSALEPKNP